MASTSASASFHPTETLLERAKYYSKAGEHLKARRFYHCYTVAFPSACRAFVSWAQVSRGTWAANAGATCCNANVGRNSWQSVGKQRRGACRLLTLLTLLTAHHRCCRCSDGEAHRRRL